MSVRQRKDGRCIVRLRDPEERKGIPIRSVKQKPQMLLPYPARNCQDPSNKNEIILRSGFLMTAFQDGALMDLSWEMVDSRPGTLREHYHHVKSVVHRDSMDWIFNLVVEDEV